MASDLVEKVRAEMVRAMRDGHPQENYGYRQAQYAIKAIAEWQMGRDAEQWMAGSILLDQLKEPPHE